MNETRRTQLEAIPPVPAILGAIVSVQGGAALAKGLFPALGPVGTVGRGTRRKDEGRIKKFMLAS